METAVVVKVAVSAAPYSIDKPYDYLVPEALNISIKGTRNGKGRKTKCSAPPTND